MSPVIQRTLAAALVSAALAGAAQAQDSRYYLHVGPGQLAPDEDAVVFAGGSAIPGGNVAMDSSLTAAAEFGVRLSPEFAVSLTGGLPPREDVRATGSLAPFGKLGELEYGPAALTAHYHFTRFGAFQPYFGGGVAVMFVFADDDGAAANLEVDNAAGGAVQVGADWMLNERWGLLVDYKKAWFDTSASGSLGGAPFEADIRVDPSFLHAGATVRF